MTKNKSRDKNLQKVVKQLDQPDAGSHHAQQVQQQRNDHRHQDALNHDEN